MSRAELNLWAPFVSMHDFATFVMALILHVTAKVLLCCHFHQGQCPELDCNAALQEKRIRGAGLDVTYTEPLPKESPLWDLDNVLLSPHCADRTTTFQAEAIQQFTDLAKMYVQDKELYNVVDKETGY